MKKLFDAPSEKTIKKALFQSLLVSCFSIVFCLFAFCSMTYAWFSEGMTSSENRITSGYFDLDISVSRVEDHTATAEVIDVIEEEDGTLRCTLPGAGSYRVTLTRTSGSTANGYCYVTVGSAAAQATQTILDASPENANASNPFVFTITVEKETSVQFEPCWGIHANPEIIHKGTAPVADNAGKNE